MARGLNKDALLFLGLASTLEPGFKSRVLPSPLDESRGGRQQCPQLGVEQRFGRMYCCTCDRPLVDCKKENQDG